MKQNSEQNRIERVCATNRTCQSTYIRFTKFASYSLYRCRVAVVKKISLDGETKGGEMKCRIVESLRSRIPPLSYASYHIRVDRRLAPAKRVEK